MAQNEEEKKLIEKVSADFEVPLPLVEGLLALEKQFQSMPTHGAKARLQRSVAELIDTALEPDA